MIRTMRKGLFLMGILAVISVPLMYSVLYADEIETRRLRLDLSECIKLALTNNPETKEAFYSVEASRGRLDEAKTGMLPKMEITNLTGLIPAAHGDALFSDDRITDTDDLGIFNKLELQIVQPIYTFGKITGFRKAAAKGLEVEIAKSDKKRDEIIFMVKQLYHNLVFTREVFSIVNEVRTNFEKALKTAQERLESGSGKITQSDILKLKVGLAETRKEYEKLKNAIETISFALKRELGLNRNTDFDIKTESLKPDSVDLKDLEEYISMVFKNRPEWKQIEAGIDARRALLQTKESDLYPTFFLGGGIYYAVAPNRTDQKNPFVRDDYNYFDAGLALGMRWLLDFSATSARIRSARAELNMSLEQKKTAALGFPVEVGKAYREVIENKAKIDISQDGRKAARSLLVLCLTNFDFGIGEAKDLFEALFIYTKSVSSYLKAVRSYNLSLARLSLVVGKEITGLKY